MKKVYILGSINTDFVISADIFPEAGETVGGHDFFTAEGGKGANQAVACARQGGSVCFCGAVGNDSFGERAKSDMAKDGIDVSGIKTVEGTSTGAAVIILYDGDNRIILSPGANATVTEKDIDRFLQNAREGDIFLTQLEVSAEAVLYAIKKAYSLGMYVILNPAPAKREILPFLPYCHMLIPNETECSALGGEELLRGQVSVLIVTLGEKGFCIYEGDGKREFPCPKVKAVDTTAAGDTFCGALACFLSRDIPLEQAALRASRAASLACTVMGAQSSIPYGKDCGGP